MMKILSKQKNGDIDIITDSLNEMKNYFEKKKFIYVKYIFKKTGFFMKKLTTKGIITFHLQNEIFFIKKNKLIIIKGFSKLILNNNNSYIYMIYMMKIYPIR